IVFRKEIDEAVAELECDSEQLTQILLNLTINAIQAMPEGGEIRLAAHRQGGNAVIEVRDQGMGISEENLEKIFDPFFTTKESGTGLGLPVAHQIAAPQGGVLSAAKNPDQGMTFSLEIPLSRERIALRAGAFWWWMTMRACAELLRCSSSRPASKRLPQ